MAGLDDIGAAVQVKDVMSTSVVTVLEGDRIDRVAKLMDAHNIGSIIVTDTAGKPVGIITERDIVKRVAARDLLPSDVKSREIMSYPLVTVSYRTGLDEAARKMSRRGIRRLVVIDRNRLVGIITSKDIIAITPALAEIITERARITQRPLVRERSPMAGYCDNCRQWSDSLKEVEGRFLCEECRMEFE
ncbi:MAG: cyclic nucleotide-binding/CBS domain-containing protein [Candidatus Bathyarchaeia archaeon]